MKKLLLLLLLIPVVAQAQNPQRRGQATQNSSGFVKVLAGASVKVCAFNVALQCNTVVPIFQDSADTISQSNPLTANANGQFSYYVPNGNYIEQVSSPGAQTQTYEITFTSGQQGSSGCSGGCIVSINGNTVPAQNIVAGTGIGVSSANGTTTVSNNGIVSVNGNSTAAQTISGGTGITVASTGGTTTVSTTNTPVYVNANTAGVTGNAQPVACNITGGSSTINCFTAGSIVPNFNASTDVGKTFLCYDCGSLGTTFVGTPTYVSGGTAPTGFPSGTWQQRVDFTNGGPGGAACTTPPAGLINVVNGVPSGNVSILWAGDGCVTPPTTGQIAGFTGTSTFSGGSLGNQTQVLTITAVNSSSSITVSPTPITTLGGRVYIYGTDDTAAWLALIAAHPGSAQIVWAGPSIISNTLAFFNYSGFLNGVANLPQQSGLQPNSLGSALIWAGPAAIPMIDNQGGSNMSYQHFTLIGDASHPPIGISLTAYAPSGAQLGAQNLVDDVVFGLYSSVDPSVSNGEGTWAFQTGIFANTVPGNADFQRLCVGVGCTFNNAKYPTDGNNDQAVDWEWGTVRVFNAHDAFCMFGAPHVAVMETAFTYGSAIVVGGCQYPGTGTSYAGNGVFDNVSSDGDPQLISVNSAAGTTGEGTVVIHTGGFGYGWLHNDGLLINGSAPGANIKLDLHLSVGAGVGVYSGFPPVQATVPISLAARTNVIDGGPGLPYTSFSNAFTRAGLQSGNQGEMSNAVVITENGGYFGNNYQTIVSKYPDAIVAGLHHHQEQQTMGVTEASGTFQGLVLRSPDAVGVFQVTGATPGTTTYYYAVQCVVNNRLVALNFNARNQGENFGPSYAGSITTGAATLTPTNANAIQFVQMQGCEAYQIYRYNGTTFQCLAKNNQCIQAPYNAAGIGVNSFIDDGSYTLGAFPNIVDQSGSVQASGGVLVGATGHPLSPSDLVLSSTIWPLSAGIAAASGENGVDFAPHTMTTDNMVTWGGTGPNIPATYVASASTESSGPTNSNSAWNAFDGKLGPDGAWVGTGGGSDFLQIDLGSGMSEELAAYAVQAGDQQTAQQAPQAWTMLGSNDGATWTTLDTQTSQSYWNPGEVRYFTLSSPSAGYRYFQLNITANNGDPTFTGVGELYLYEAGWMASYNASNPIPYAYLGTGGTGAGTKCLVDNMTWSSSCGTGGGGAVSSVFGRTGAVVAQTGDYSVAQVTGAAVDSTVVHKTGAESVAGVKTFSNNPSVPTPVGTTDAANKAYVDASSSINPSLPSGMMEFPQGTYSLSGLPTGECYADADTSVGMQFRTSTGALCGPPPMFNALSKTANYTAVAADFAVCRLIQVPSGTFTITLVASGSQPLSGQCIWVVNYGTGTVTIAPSGQNINGAGSSVSVAQTQGAFVTSDGTNYVAQLFGTGGGSVSVNGSSVVSPNFNKTTPAAGTGYQNVTWQASGSSVSAEAPQTAWVLPVYTVQGSGTVLGGGYTTTGQPSVPALTAGSSSLPAISGAAFPVATKGTQFLEWHKKLENNFTSLASVYLAFYSDTATSGNAIWDVLLGCSTVGGGTQPTYGTAQALSTQAVAATNTNYEVSLASPTFSCAAGSTIWVRLRLDSGTTVATGNLVLTDALVNEIR